MSEPFPPAVLEPHQLSLWLGREVGTSRWFALDQARFDLFLQTLETAHDPASGFTADRRTQCAQMLVLSLLAAMSRETLPKLAGSAMGVNYGFEEVRWGPPPPIGSEVRGRFSLKSAEEKPGGRWLLCHSVRVESPGREAAVLDADWLVMRVVKPPVENDQPRSPT